METRVLSCRNLALASHALECACEVLRSGEVVGIPAETVYGLAGDALNPAAAARIFEAKERPFFDPLICHLPGMEWLERLTLPVPGCGGLLEALTTAFWPGPLTLVLPRRESVPDLVSSGLPTVAVRWSAHPVLQAVLDLLGRPLAAPSANRFGRISPTSAAHVLEELQGRIPLILDGGPTVHGVESTIVAMGEKGLRILRNGPVTREQLEAFAPVQADAGAGEFPEAPGQLKSHYAPLTPLELLGEGGEVPPASEAAGLLSWMHPAPGFGANEVLSPSGSLVEAASRLFAAMRRLDAAGLEKIYAERVPSGGLGAAINDRLSRAAAR